MATRYAEAPARLTRVFTTTKTGYDTRGVIKVLDQFFSIAFLAMHLMCETENSSHENKEISVAYPFCSQSGFSVSCDV